MYFLSTILLGLLMSPAMAYKLPLWNEPFVTDNDNTIDKPYNSPFGIAFKWEWQSQDSVDEDKLMLARVRRASIDKNPPKVDDQPDEESLPTESLLEDISDSTPYILETSSVPLTSTKKMPILNKEKTTPLPDIKQATKELDEDETATLTDFEQTTNGSEQILGEDETTHIGKSITQSQTLVTESPLNPITSEKLSVLPSKTFNKATTVSQINSQDGQDISSPQATTNDKLLEDTTYSSSPKAPKTSPTSPTSTSVILQDLTTEHYVTSSSSAKPSGVTSISTSLEDKGNTQSIMRQCMLTILILAVVCTIFIISTIALAAKLSSMKQKNKLRHPITYTEMRCISSLMPDNDQQNKPKPKRLKTFASSIEESDGDNTTLNSFLPDH